MSRTVTKYVRLMIDDSGGTAREVPINTLSPVGFTYDETEQTAWQDAVKGYLSNHPDAAVDFGGPLSNDAAAALAASGATPTLSGSFTILNAICGGVTPLGFVVGFGMSRYYTNGDPAFGVAVQSATQGYLLTKFVIEGDQYSARVVPFPGSTPSWVNTVLA